MCTGIPCPLLINYFLQYKFVLVMGSGGSSVDIILICMQKDYTSRAY